MTCRTWWWSSLWGRVCWNLARVRKSPDDSGLVGDCSWLTTMSPSQFHLLLHKQTTFQSIVTQRCGGLLAGARCNWIPRTAWHRFNSRVCRRACFMLVINLRTLEFDFSHNEERSTVSFTICDRCQLSPLKSRPYGVMKNAQWCKIPKAKTELVYLLLFLCPLVLHSQGLRN